MTSGEPAKSSLAELLCHLDADNAVAKIDLEVSADRPAQLRQLFAHGGDARLDGWIVEPPLLEPADPARAFGLRADIRRRKRHRRSTAQ
jgi:hypothetical protein